MESYSELVESTKVERAELIFKPLANKIFNQNAPQNGPATE